MLNYAQKYKITLILLQIKMDQILIKNLRKRSLICG